MLIRKAGLRPTTIIGNRCRSIYETLLVSVSCVHRGNGWDGTCSFFPPRPRLCTQSHNRWFRRQGAKAPRRVFPGIPLEHFLPQICPLITRSCRAHRSTLSWNKRSPRIFHQQIARTLLAVRNLSLALTCDVNVCPCSAAYYSEDEQDCDEACEEIVLEGERESFSTLPSQPPPPPPPSQHTPRPSERAMGKKTSGNSNSTNVSSGGGGGQPPEFAALPALAGTVPRHSPAPVSVTTNAAMPPSSRVPPPSSRAAGKQPMNYSSQPANPNPPATTTRSARAASKQPLSAANYPHNPTHHHPSPPSSNASSPHKNRQNAPASTQPAKNNKIWSTSSTEERERIKEFWLGLGEEERRNLVKVEKEAVLKKMKEQQKHSCSCAVCGRKRSVPLSPIFLSEKFSLTENPPFLVVNRLFRGLDFRSMPLFFAIAISPCSTVLRRLPPASLSTIVTGMRLRTSSRYCTMLITRS